MRLHVSSCVSTATFMASLRFCIFHPFYSNTILILAPISPCFSDNETYRLQNPEQHQQHFLPLHLSGSALSIFPFPADSSSV